MILKALIVLGAAIVIGAVVFVFVALFAVVTSDSWWHWYLRSTGQEDDEGLNDS